ncbi:hypothetical protein M758_8G140800 [Ceratodon purpureus]|nr:hypothetical protein M758_8G140800 [Ceratodon purpureus]
MFVCMVRWEDAPGGHAPAPDPVPTQRGQARGQARDQARDQPRGRGGRRGRATSKTTARSTSSRTVISSSSGSSMSSGTRGQHNSTRGTFVSATGDSDTVCFRCNQTGHWANACPTRNM